MLKIISIVSLHSILLSFPKLLLESRVVFAGLIQPLHEACLLEDKFLEVEGPWWLVVASMDLGLNMGQFRPQLVKLQSP